MLCTTENKLSENGKFSIKLLFLDQVISYALMKGGDTGRISAKKGTISMNVYIDNYREVYYLYPFLTK